MKASSTFSILFWVDFSRTSNQLAPLYARITVNGKRSNISLKRKVPVDDWGADKSRLRGTKETARLINNYLDQIHSDIFESYRQLKAEKKKITSQAVKARFLGEDQEHYSLLALVEYHNTEASKNIRWGTLKNYFTTKKYIKLFLKKRYKTSDIFLSELSYKFIVDFEQYLRNYQPSDFQQKMGNNTVMKHIERLRKMVNLAYKMEWIDKDPFVKFKAKYIRKDRAFLTQYELEALANKKFRIERLEIVRDLFLFSCYTGLSYSDAMNLTPSHINIGIDGNKWIITKRIKTDTPVKIPLLPVAKNLIDKYKDHPKVNYSGKLLPNLSNQKMNAYLKEIADICGIEKNITFHIARHTFATTVTLSNGVPIETVSKLLGHSNITTTQIYARVLEKKVSEDMELLKRKLS